jgi:hypothetical protein
MMKTTVIVILFSFSTAVYKEITDFVSISVFCDVVI